MQDKGTIGVEALQAFRVGVRNDSHSIGLDPQANLIFYSGDKKTKGQALVF